MVERGEVTTIQEMSPDTQQFVTGLNSVLSQYEWEDQIELVEPGLINLAGLTLHFSCKVIRQPEPETPPKIILFHGRSAIWCNQQVYLYDKTKGEYLKTEIEASPLMETFEPNLDVIVKDAPASMLDLGKVLGVMEFLRPKVKVKPVNEQATVLSDKQRAVREANWERIARLARALLPPRI